MSEQGTLKRILIWGCCIAFLSVVLGGVAFVPKKANALKCQSPSLYLELDFEKLIETTSEEDLEENLVILEETRWPDSCSMEYSGPESFQLSYWVGEEEHCVGILHDYHFRRVDWYRMRRKVSIGFC